MIRQSKNERGMALIVVLFALMLLTAIGLGLMYMTTTETGIDNNFRSEQQAYYASKAGLEEARDRLRYPTTCSGSTCVGTYPANSFTYYLPAQTALSAGWALPTTTPAANTGSVVYIINSMGGSDTVTPWTAGSTYFDDELCHENFTGLGLTATASTVPCATAPSGNNWYTTVTSTDPNNGTSSATPYKWVRITLKQDNSPPYCSDYNGTSCPNSTRPVCLKMNGASPYLPPYYETPLPATYNACEDDNMRSIFVLTSLAKLSNGARKMTQYEVASIVLPPMPGSITMDGPNPVLSGITSSSMTASGYDAHNPSSPDYPSGGDGCTSPYTSTTQPALAAYNNAAVTTLNGDIPKPTDFQGTGGTPSLLNQSSQLGQLSTVAGLEALVANVTATADQVYGNNPTISNLGTPSNPLVTVVNGNFSMGNAQGAGILLVTGTLTQSGNPNWDGLILVIGKGDIEKSGGGNGTVNGAILVANICSVCPPSSPVTYLPSSGAPGTPTINWQGGGTANINYDSCWINNLSQHSSLRVLASHEEVY